MRQCVPFVVDKGVEMLQSSDLSLQRLHIFLFSVAMPSVQVVSLLVLHDCTQYCLTFELDRPVVVVSVHWIGLRPRRHLEKILCSLGAECD